MQKNEKNTVKRTTKKVLGMSINHLEHDNELHYVPIADNVIAVYSTRRFHVGFNNLCRVGDAEVLNVPKGYLGVFQAEGEMLINGLVSACDVMQGDSADFHVLFRNISNRAVNIYPCLIGHIYLVKSY